MASPREEILRVVRDILAPLVRADGGDVYLIRAEDDAVELHLAGRFSGCPGNTLAKRRVIEPAILAVAPGARITITSGVTIPDGAQKVET